MALCEDDSMFSLFRTMKGKLFIRAAEPLLIPVPAHLTFNLGSTRYFRICHSL